MCCHAPYFSYVFHNCSWCEPRILSQCATCPYTFNCGFSIFNAWSLFLHFLALSVTASIFWFCNFNRCLTPLCNVLKFCSRHQCLECQERKLHFLSVYKLHELGLCVHWIIHFPQEWPFVHQDDPSLLTANHPTHCQEGGHLYICKLQEYIQGEELWKHLKHTVFHNREWHISDKEKLCN